MHILGFNSNMYSTYLDIDEGSGITHAAFQSGPAALNENRPTSYLLTTPKVTAWAQDFFSCYSITGMQLENQDAAQPGSHWERVTMYDELMTGT